MTRRFVSCDGRFWLHDTAGIDAAEVHARWVVDATDAEEVEVLLVEVEIPATDLDGVVLELLNRRERRVVVRRNVVRRAA